MKRSMLTITSAVCAAGLIAIIVGSHTLSAQDEHADKGDKDKPPPVYNPYPPGILPADLDSEIARVLREIDVIEGRAIERWHSLPLPTRLGIRPGPNPPVLKDTGTESIETLGELMLFDKNMSPGRNQACTSCHMPYAGWSGPIPSVNADDNRLSRNGSLSGRQADGAATHVCTVLPCAAIQPRTATILWREFLGFTRDRI